jgi:hypothetical protein
MSRSFLLQPNININQDQIVEWGDITGTLSNQTDLQNALNAKADLNSPSFTGTPTAPTPILGDDSTKIATTEFVQDTVNAQTVQWGDITGTLSNQTDLQNALNAKADLNTTYLLHEPMITSSVSSSSPGQIPDPYLISPALLGLKFIATDEAYRMFRIQSVYAGEASLHVHWTKSDNINESGKVVKWRVQYCVFPGNNGNPSTIYEVSDIDTYESSDLNSRIIYRTANMDISAQLQAGWYVGVKVDYVSGETTLISSPVLVSLDLLVRNYINKSV